MEKENSFVKGLKTGIATLGLFICAILYTGIGQTIGDLLNWPLVHAKDAGLVFAGFYGSFIGIWIVVLAMMWIRKKNRYLLSYLSPKSIGNKLGPSLVIGLLLGIGMNLTVALVAILHGDIHLSFQAINLPMFLFFLVAVMIQSGAEELVCRFYLYRKLQEKFKRFPLVWILGNSLLFGLLHATNPGVTVKAIMSVILVGVLYSLVIYYFDSFWGVVIAHTTWNFCQSILLGLPNSGIVSAYSVFKLDAARATSSFAYDTGFGIEGSLLTNILLVLAIIAVVYIGRKKKEKEAAEERRGEETSLKQNQYACA